MLNIHVYPSPMTNESRILREARSLARLGLFDQIELVGIADGRLAPDEPLAGDVTIRRLGRPRGAGGTARKLADTLAWSAAVFGRYRDRELACINCHAVSVLPLCAALKAATGARLVYDAHELESEANGLSPLRRRLAREVERALIHRADYCLFVGQAILDWYRQAYRPARAAVLYNCPNLTRPAPSDRFRERFGIPPHVPVFLYQGFLGEGRGLRATIEAFAGLPERAALVVMGYGPLAGFVADAARRNANVHLHDAVPPGELLGHTAAADFGLSIIEPTSLSYDYCMPNKLFEYVMAMKPVLVSPTVEQRDFVRRHGIGAVAPDATARGVREGVLALLAMDRAGLDAALAATREAYCWERQEVALQRIYTEALGFVPRSPPPLAAREVAS